MTVNSLRRLSGSGGSGLYTWSSHMISRVGVSQEGVVTGREEGTVEVTASDVKNPENSAASQVNCFEGFMKGKLRYRFATLAKTLFAP